MTEISRQHPAHYSILLNSENLQAILSQNTVELTERQELQQIEIDTLHYQHGFSKDEIAHRLNVIFGPETDTTSELFKQQAQAFQSGLQQRIRERPVSTLIRNKRK